MEDGKRIREALDALLSANREVSDLQWKQRTMRQRLVTELVRVGADECLSPNVGRIRQLLRDSAE